MKRFLFSGLLVAAGLAASDHSRGQGGQATTHRVFELRTYYVNKGKLDDLNTRFRDHTCDLLKKHGAELIGFWTPTDEKDGKGGKLVYLLAFPSREAAAKTWEAFRKDPEWNRVRDESHKNGVLVDRVELGVPRADRLQRPEVSRALGTASKRNGRPEGRPFPLIDVTFLWLITCPCGCDPPGRGSGSWWPWDARWSSSRGAWARRG